MKRSTLLVGGGLVAVAALAAAAIKGTILGTLSAFVVSSFHPQSIDWNAKDAWSKCEGAVAGSIAWPRHSVQACEAMRMCQNEASLDPQRRAALDAAIGRLPGCGAP